MKLRASLAFMLCLTGPLAGQSVETLYFRAVLLPANEVPAVGSSNKGVADVTVHAVLDSTGQIVSGTVNVVTHVNLTASVAITGMDIWKGAAGQNGSVAISTGLSAANDPIVQSGSDLVQAPAVVSSPNASAMAALRDLVQNPASYYLNLLTATSPNGAIRGQLQRAQTAVLLAMMSSSNMPAPPSLQAYGVAKLIAIGTQDSKGNWTSGELFFSAGYTSADFSTFTSFQIHQATAAPNTAAALAATLPGGLTADPSGSGSFGPFYTELTTTTATQTAAFNALFFNPSSLYIDLHTSANPGGLMLGTLRHTDAMQFPLLLSSANEQPVPSVAAAAPSNLTLYTIRDATGAPLAGLIFTDIDYTFPGPTQFISVDLHTGAAGQSGAIALHLANQFYDPAGVGNYGDWCPPIQDTGLLNSVIGHPGNYYVSMNTLDAPGGAVRGQLAAPPTGVTSVAAAIAADLDKNAATVAPGELFSIFGVNLANVATDLSGWSGQVLPSALNGLSVTVAGQTAPLVYVSPGQVNAQVPFGIAAGNQPVVVSGPNGLSGTYALQIGAVAPAIFFYPAPAVLKNADYSLLSASNPAKAGDVILIYCTGLGQTNPPLATGAISSAIAYTPTVTATMGGAAANVVYAIASPSFPGLYQVAVTVPAGLTGVVPLVLKESGVASNSINVTLH